jgi:hypothetical protein
MIKTCPQDPIAIQMYLAQALDKKKTEIVRFPLAWEMYVFPFVTYYNTVLL